MEHEKSHTNKKATWLFRSLLTDHVLVSSYRCSVQENIVVDQEEAMAVSLATLVLDQCARKRPSVPCSV